jgi:hypothetical protein
MIPKGYTGFKGGKRLQGGWIGAAIGLAGSLFGASQAKKQAKEQAKLAEKGIAAADPYAKYRDAAAQKLNALMNDPSSLTGTAEYKARQTAAERLMAAQGYTGSGNAIEAAADASSESYQQAFSNLATLSGAGVTPGGGYGNALSAGQNANDSTLSGYAGIANNAVNLANTLWNRRVTTPTRQPTGGVITGGYSTTSGG